ncbi:hypothetical protein Tco_0410640 [Tanacetum coccineum]
MRMLCLKLVLTLVHTVKEFSHQSSIVWLFILDQDVKSQMDSHNRSSTSVASLTGVHHLLKSDSNEETLRSKPNRDAKFGIGIVVVGIVVVVKYVFVVRYSVSWRGLLNLANQYDEADEFVVATTGGSVV